MRTAVENLCGCDLLFQARAGKFAGGTDGGASAAVSSSDEFISAINGHAGVKFLQVCLQGTPEMIRFADHGAIIRRSAGAPAHNRGNEKKRLKRKII